MFLEVMSERERKGSQGQYGISGMPCQQAWQAFQELLSLPQAVTGMSSLSA